MKQKKLAEKISKVARHIKKTNLIENCEKVAIKFGKGETTVHSAHTNINYAYNKDGLKVHIDDGYSMFGGGRLEVSYDNQQVLITDRNEKRPFNKENPYDESIPQNPQISQWYICKYNPGKWESIIKRLAKNGPKKEKIKDEKPEEREVSPTIVKDITSRFGVR